MDKIPIGLMIQVDTLCHKIPNFMEKCKRAGVTRVFIGLENINPENLKAAKKPQNKITEYRKMLLAWKAQGIFTYAGYILGFPADTPDRSAAISRSSSANCRSTSSSGSSSPHCPARKTTRSCGSRGDWMDPNLNNYDLSTSSRTMRR